METTKMDFELDKTYWLSTDGFTFRYRKDRYNPMTVHVELFKNGDVVHKQMAKSADYGVSKSHHEIINELEAKILLNQLDRTGLKQTV